MTILVDRSRFRRFGPGRAALLTLVLTAAIPAAASAQGRCSCNSGCHMFPGQCVQPGSAGCEAGFAPFCSTRSSTCPNASWVSCSGTCTCVRIVPLDAGVPDAGRADVPTPPDAPSPTDGPARMDLGAIPDAPVATDIPFSIDVPSLLDRPAAIDASPVPDGPVPDGPVPDGPVPDGPVPDGPVPDGPVPGDALVSMDVRPAVDVPGADGPGSDRASPGDAGPVDDATVVLTDRPAGAPDSPVPSLDGGSTEPDGGCVCVGGACIADVCYRERCTYQPELGFTCSTPGTSCRLIDGNPWCVPLCAGVTCGAGEFCDPRSNGTCVTDRCATITCPSGTTCVRNQCGRWSSADGGPFVPDDAASEADGGGPTITATDDGCGCRVGQTGRGAARGGFTAALLALLALVRRRRRDPTAR